MLVERLLGALELAVAGLELTGAPGLSPYVGQPPAGKFAFLSSAQESVAVTAARLLEQLRPGFADLVAALARRLAADQSIAAPLAGAAATEDEPAIAAAHGAGYLALTVATATAVFDQVHVPAAVDRSAAVLGTAIGTAALLLRAAPMPAGYAAALLAKVRAEYLLPRRSAGSVPVTGHRFGLVEGELPDEVGKGLTAVARFTGRGITAEDLERIESADVAFRIVPDLPTLYPYRPRPSLGPAEPLVLDDETVSRMPEPRLRELAWWAAGEAARHAGLVDDPEIVASIAARALTPGALDRARRSQLDGGEHQWLWLALHRATNPDARAAAVEALGAARFAAGPHAAELLEGARQRVTG